MHALEEEKVSLEAGKKRLQESKEKLAEKKRLMVDERKAILEAARKLDEAEKKFANKLAEVEEITEVTGLNFFPIFGCGKNGPQRIDRKSGTGL